MLTGWFDRAFVLTTRNAYKDRISATMDHLRNEDIGAEEFIGFDGTVTGLKTDHTYELDHPGTNYRIGAKTVSMYLGHLCLWKVAEYISGDSFLFMEDDVRFNPGWKEHWEFAVPALPSDWDLLYLGSCCCMDKPRQRISGQLYKVGYALCTHAYGVRKKALPKLLEACEKVYAGVDVAMCLHAIPILNTYAFLPRLADQHKTNILP